MTFLPQDYKQPKADGNYMKLEEGQNRFRILSEAVVGWEYWNNQNKPVRSQTLFKTIPGDIRMDPSGRPSRIRHFWAFKVWNYATEKVQILQISQSTVQGAMKIKIDNRDGDAFGYDFIITRKGKGIDTDYDIDVGDKLPADPKIIIAKNTTHIDLTALFRGEDPFGVKKGHSEPVNASSEVSNATNEATTNNPSDIIVDNIPF